MTYEQVWGKHQQFIALKSRGPLKTSGPMSMVRRFNLQFALRMSSDETANLEATELRKSRKRQSTVLRASFDGDVRRREVDGAVLPFASNETASRPHYFGPYISIPKRIVNAGVSFHPGPLLTFAVAGPDRTLL